MMTRYSLYNSILILSLLSTLLLIMLVGDVNGQECPVDCQCFGSNLLCRPSLPDGRLSSGYIPARTTTLTVVSDDLRNISAEDLAGLPNLEELSLISRNLGSIEPGTFGSLESLTTLGIYLAEELRVVDEDLVRGLTQLENLRVEGTSVDRFTERAIAILSNLRSLNLIANGFAYLPDNFLIGLNITHLRMGSNALSNISRNAFASLSMLIELDLEFNDLNTFSGDIFQSLSNLEVLNLKSNNIVTLSATSFRGLNSLRVLNLNENLISFLSSDSFTGNTNLREIYLESNQLTFLPNGLFNGLLSLSTADFTDNKLTTISRAVFEPVRNMADVTINLAGNPLHCDCYNEWLQSTSDTTGMICTSPARVTGLPISSLNVTHFTCTRTAAIGISVQIVCPVPYYSPDWQVSWQVPSGNIINSDTASDIFEVTTEGVLTIVNFSAEDAGEYVCYMVDAEQNIIGTDTVTLELAPLPSEMTSTHMSSSREVTRGATTAEGGSPNGTVQTTIQQTDRQRVTENTGSRNVEIFLGSNGSISVNAQYPISYNYIWIAPGGIQIEKNETVDRFTVLIDGTLMINVFAESDIGIYTVYVIDPSNVVVSTRVLQVSLRNFTSASTPTENTDFSTTSREDSQSGSPTVESSISSRSSLSTVSLPVTEQTLSTEDAEGVIYVDRDEAFITAPKPSIARDVTFRWVTPDAQILFVNDTSGPYTVSPEGDLRIQPVNDISVGTYVVFVTDVSGFELDFRVFRVQITREANETSGTERMSSETSTISSSSSTTAYVMISSTEELFTTNVETMMTSMMESDTTDAALRTTKQQNITVKSGEGTTFTPSPSTQRTEEDAFTVTIASLQRVVLSPEYDNLQNLSVVWVTPIGTRISKSQTVGSFSVSINGFLTIEPILNSMIGVYTVLITDSDGVVLDLNVIQLVLVLPTTEYTTNAPGLFTTDVTNNSFTSLLPTPALNTDPGVITMGPNITREAERTTNDTTTLFVDTTDDINITTFSTAETDSQPPQTNKPTEPIDTPTTSTETPDEDLFDLRLTQRTQAILFPQYPNIPNITFTWITPDAITLRQGESFGPYNVTGEGQLIIQPVIDTNIGTYTVSIIDVNGFARDLNVIRVTFVDSTTPNLRTTSPTTLTNELKTELRLRNSSTEVTSESGFSTIEYTTEDSPNTDTTDNGSAPLTPTHPNESRSTPERLGTTSPVFDPTTIQAPDPELFLRDGMINALFPRIPNGLRLNVRWVTPDGITLTKGDAVGPYSVNNFGQLAISSVSVLNEGTYSVLLTDLDGIFVNLYVIRVMVYSVTSSSPTEVIASTDKLLTGTSHIKTDDATTDSITERMSTHETSTTFELLSTSLVPVTTGSVTTMKFPQASTDSFGSTGSETMEPEATSLETSTTSTSTTKSTDQTGSGKTTESFEMTPTKVPAPEPELFLIDGMINAVFPRIPNGLSLNVRWVTPDGISLTKGDANGPYSVNDAGQLLISLVSISNEGTYSVLLTDSNGIFVALYVIRVTVYSSTTAQTTNVTEDTSSTGRTPRSDASTDMDFTSSSVSFSSLLSTTDQFGSTMSERRDTEATSLGLSTSRSFISPEGSTETARVSTKDTSSYPTVDSSTTGQTQEVPTETPLRQTTEESASATGEPTTSESISSGTFTPRPTGFITDRTTLEPFSMTRNDISTDANILSSISIEQTTYSFMDRTSTPLLSTSKTLITGQTQDIPTGTERLLTTEDSTTESDMSLTTEDQLETISPTTPKSTTAGTTLDSTSKTTAAISTETTDIFSTSVTPSTRSGGTISSQPRETIESTKPTTFVASTTAGNEVLPSYVIPLSVGIGLAIFAFILILLALCTTMAKTHRENYGVHLTEQEKIQKGELVPIGDIDEESGLGKEGLDGMAENGHSNTYTIEPEQNGSSNSRIVTIVGKDGTGYDTIYYADGSEQGAYAVPYVFRDDA